jgi:hypothetical protein
MALVTFSTSELAAGLGDAAQTRAWAVRLEAGDLLYFPATPIAIPAADLDFLLDQQQAGSGYHKNIAYRPAEDRVTGFVAQQPETEAQLRGIMGRYSRSVVEFLTRFLAPYQQRWKLDYASYRPQEEQGRDLKLTKRNDLMHTDAFPTRPTGGDRILRFFNNINPQRSREWITGGTFDMLARRFAGSAEVARKNGVPLPASLDHASLGRMIAAAGKSIGLAAVVPALARSPYDDFMHRFHNWLKENNDYQQSALKQPWSFPPGSSWMCYTDMVSHAVLSGQYALEQTFIVSRAAMVTPEMAPISVLEQIVGGRLA